ncbi:hypothetical protein [Bradyrhizobium sp. LB11.1]|uniref:hypothetical protein n=1 Tax=Bradyrhizobium sp. LB11.1 TaxID=3156326 RepID=UPI0033988696
MSEAEEAPAKRKRIRQRTYDAKGRQLHQFKDTGPPIDERDFKPRVYGDPDQALAAAFTKAGADYGGALPPGALGNG